MKKICFILLSLILIFQSSCYLTPEQYEEIKRVATWEVLPYPVFLSIFGNKTFDQVTSRIGQFSTEPTFLHGEETIKQATPADYTLTAAPLSFDWRVIYPQCFRPARNQGDCGSCYAFSIVVTLEQRICLVSKSKTLIELSPQDIVSCDSKNDKCQGGTLGDTWRYAENAGVLTEKCYPYVSGNMFVPSCPSKCVFAKDQFFRFKAIANTYKLISNPELVKIEIVTYGPVSTWLKTFEDFGAYKGGIYEYKYGRETDPHAVIIVGYGSENGKNYWIVRNSWGALWGENGHFRIITNSINLIERNIGVSNAPMIN